MLCGNKTDECPKCQKYVRRAIFTYHYENECADLDESSEYFARDVQSTSENSEFHFSFSFASHS